MKIHEYQAKGLLRQYGIPTPLGDVATTPQEAQQIARSLGGRAVVKVQIHAGGRGKAGGVKVVHTPQNAQQVAAELLGKRLVTFQTGPEGAPVNQVLVEEPLEVERELYLSITTDGSLRRTVVIASAAGGMEIEEVAATTPELILRTTVDPMVGFQPYQGRKLAHGLGLPWELVRPFADLVQGCYRLFTEKDCSQVEINPLMISVDGRVLALDAKVTFDDDALFRHPELLEFRDPQQEDPLEKQAGEYNIAYVKLDGDVGCMVNGAGLAMATMDIIKLSGAQPANFLDVGGGASQEKVERAFSLLLGDPQVKRVLVNIFGGILRCDIAAGGIVAACQKREVEVPIVLRMLGTNVEEGKAILRESGLNIALATTFEEAAQLISQA